MDIQADKVRQHYREAIAGTSTESGIPLKAVYTAEDIAGLDPERDLPLPGEFP